MLKRDAGVEDVVAHLRRQRAHRVIGVLTVLYHRGLHWRGKVKLGRLAGVRGRNGYAARPVESAKRLGLIDEKFERGAYEYTLNDFGWDVLHKLWER